GTRAWAPPAASPARRPGRARAAALSSNRQGKSASSVAPRNGGYRLGGADGGSISADRRRAIPGLCEARVWPTLVWVDAEEGRGARTEPPERCDLSVALSSGSSPAVVSPVVRCATSVSEYFTVLRMGGKLGT